MNWDFLNLLVGSVTLYCLLSNLMVGDVLTMIIVAIMAYCYLIGFTPGKFWKAEVKVK